MNDFYWSLRRELWESRSIYIAPLVMAAVALVGFVVNVVQLPAKIRAATPHGAIDVHNIVELPYDFTAGLIMFATLAVAVFYTVDALYGERRDRSILFWKSMPVSDRTTVLAKASIPIVILPLGDVVLTVIVQLVEAVISSFVLAANGLSVAAYWSALSFTHMSLLLLYHMIAVHALAWAPFFAWMLLVSAWARRAPFVWVFLPPLALVMVERIAFGTSTFASMLGHRLGGTESVAANAPTMPMNPMLTHITPGAYLADPGLWIGFVLTAVFPAAAARLRRDQVPS